MIPASYLFKDVFQQSFHDPDFAAAAARHRHGRTGRHIFSWLRRQPLDASARAASTDIDS